MNRCYFPGNRPRALKKQIKQHLVSFKEKYVRADTTEVIPCFDPLCSDLKSSFKTSALMKDGPVEAELVHLLFLNAPVRHGAAVPLSIMDIC